MGRSGVDLVTLGLIMSAAEGRAAVAATQMMRAGDPELS